MKPSLICSRKIYLLREHRFCSLSPRDQKSRQNKKFTINLAFSKEHIFTDPLHGVVELSGGALELLQGGVNEGRLVPVLSLRERRLRLGHQLHHRVVDGEVSIYQSVLDLELFFKLKFILSFKLNSGSTLGSSNSVRHSKKEVSFFHIILSPNQGNIKEKYTLSCFDSEI